MKTRHLLIYLKNPARIEVWGYLPESLKDGSLGGFQPFGMWDFLIDSVRLEWCGIQYYLNNETVSAFQQANPSLDYSLMRIRKVEDVYDDEIDLKLCAENRTTHVAQVVWSSPDKMETISALEFSDNWYASVVGSADNQSDRRFNPALGYSCLALFDVGSKASQIGVKLARDLNLEFADRS